MQQAKITRGKHGLVPKGKGWYVLNTKKDEWGHSETFGSWCTFEGDVRFPEFGINVNVLKPGQPLAMYHAENAQEDFLILAGEAVLIVEGEERKLKAWDFVHCPARTEHIIVAAGKGPCVLLAAGTRKKNEKLFYPANETAAAYDAAVKRDTSSPRTAYRRFRAPKRGRYRKGL